jgi:hypothetical protein
MHFFLSNESDQEIKGNLCTVFYPMNLIKIKGNMAVSRAGVPGVKTQLETHPGKRKVAQGKGGMVEDTLPVGWKWK